jgi:uncharacterized protein YccT (UPF0319 family)
MGKASKLKQIRKIASQMPSINTSRRVGEIVTGNTLLSIGVKEVNGKAVSSSQNYRKVTSVQSPINHTRTMKKLYNKLGAEGVRGYVAAVNDYIKVNQ